MSNPNKEEDKTPTQADAKDQDSEDLKTQVTEDKTSVVTSTSSTTTTSVKKVSLSSFEQNVVVSSQFNTEEGNFDQNDKMEEPTDDSKENNNESSSTKAFSESKDDKNKNSEPSTPEDMVIPDKEGEEKSEKAGNDKASTEPSAPTESDKKMNVDEQKSEDIDDNDETKPKSGTLEVKVIEGSDLEDKDIPGRSDPFVVLKFKEEKFKSQTVNNSLQPQWNFTTSLSVSESDSHSIEISVFDDDIVGNSYSAPQLLGSCSVSLSEALSELGKARWYPLQGARSGKVSILFAFTEDQESDEESSFEMVEEETKEEVVEEKMTEVSH